MFVSDLSTLDVSFEVALARLAALTGSGALTPCLGRRLRRRHLVQCATAGPIRFRDLITRPTLAVLAVRWETGDHDGEPFPVLDADLTLPPAGPGAALLEMVGVYRADPGEDGHCRPAKPLGGFLDRIAETITGVGAAAG